MSTASSKSLFASLAKQRTKNIKPKCTEIIPEPLDDLNSSINSQSSQSPLCTTFNGLKCLSRTNSENSSQKSDLMESSQENLDPDFDISPTKNYSNSQNKILSRDVGESVEKFQKRQLFSKFATKTSKNLGPKVISIPGSNDSKFPKPSLPNAPKSPEKLVNSRKRRSSNSEDSCKENTSPVSNRSVRSKTISVTSAGAAKNLKTDLDLEPNLNGSLSQPEFSSSEKLNLEPVATSSSQESTGNVAAKSKSNSSETKPEVKKSRFFSKPRAKPNKKINLKSYMNMDKTMSLIEKPSKKVETKIEISKNPIVPRPNRNISQKVESQKKEIYC